MVQRGFDCSKRPDRLEGAVTDHPELYATLDLKRQFAFGFKRELACRSCGQVWIEESVPQQPDQPYLYKG